MWGVSHVLQSQPHFIKEIKDFFIYLFIKVAKEAIGKTRNRLCFDLRSRAPCLSSKSRRQSVGCCKWHRIRMFYRPFTAPHQTYTASETASISRMSASLQPMPGSPHKAVSFNLLWLPNTVTDRFTQVDVVWWKMVICLLCSKALRRQ